MLLEQKKKKKLNYYNSLLKTKGMLAPINKGARLQTSGVKGYMNQARKIKGAQQHSQTQAQRKERVQDRKVRSKRIFI